MKKMKFKIVFLTLILASMLIVVDSASAAPIKFKQIVQVVNAKPGKASYTKFLKIASSR